MTELLVAIHDLECAMRGELTAEQLDIVQKMVDGE